jgi:ribosomal protein S6
VLLDLSKTEFMKRDKLISHQLKTTLIELVKVKSYHYRIMKNKKGKYYLFNFCCSDEKGTSAYLPRTL